MDLFRQGVKLVLGKLLHPVAVVMHYISSWGCRLYIQGRVISNSLSICLNSPSIAGINAVKFSDHSFRIGVATTVAEKEIEDSIIQTGKAQLTYSAPVVLTTVYFL